MVNNKLRKNLKLLGIIGTVLLASCEEKENENEADYNNGHGRDNFTVNIAGHMFDGERRQMTADVRPNSAYSVEMICSNDGDPDKITLCADGNTIGEYITAENRLGGNGWYRDQTAGPYSFTSTSNGVNLEVRTRTDEWGTWPKELRISRIE